MEEREGERQRGREGERGIEGGGDRERDRMLEKRWKREREEKEKKTGDVVTYCCFLVGGRKEAGSFVGRGRRNCKILEASYGQGSKNSPKLPFSQP